MPDITYAVSSPVKRRNPFAPIAEAESCLYCPHKAASHTGTAYAVRIEGRKYRKLIVHAIFCQACAAEKSTGQVACWQMPERVYRNFTRYGVEI